MDQTNITIICPNCKNPMKGLKNIFYCEKCVILFHDGDLFISNIFGKALFIGKFLEKKIT